MTTQPQAPFAGANALIYGAAKGIGRAVALEFARRGATVAVADIDEAAGHTGEVPDPRPGDDRRALHDDVLDTRLPDARPERSELEIKRVDDVAVMLANGMREGKVLIPTDEKAWDIIRRWAASPDAFIQAKIEQFASGDSGLPIVPPALRR